jgi:hypothetical protein
MEVRFIFPHADEEKLSDDGSDAVQFKVPAKAQKTRMQLGIGKKS